MNLVLITVDCLRADHLSCLGYPKVTTPNLDSLAGKGAVFTQAISVSIRTQPSFKALFTSTYPLTDRGQLRLADSTTTVAQVLRDRRYRTAAFHSNAWLSPYFGYDKGFDHFFDVSGYGRSGKATRRWASFADRLPSRRAAAAVGRLHKLATRQYPYWRSLVTSPHTAAEELNREILSWIEADRRGFYLWVHYMDVHEPYLGPFRLLGLYARWRALVLNHRARYNPERVSAKEIQWLVSLYDSRIAYVDREIGRLLRALEQQGVLDDTCIIVTSDHGQQLLEHGYYGHSGFHPWEELVRVPLIIAGPGVTHRVIDEQVSMIDLAPTILALLDAPKPAAFRGRSLRPLMAGESNGAGDPEAFTEVDSAVGATETSDLAVHSRLDLGRMVVSLRTGGRKYVYIQDSRDEMYDLVNDPKETRNVIDSQPEVSAEFRARIAAHIEGVTRSSGEAARLKARVQKLRTNREA